MNVLFANRYCGYFGGVEHVIATIAAGLSAMGHRCDLAYLIAGRDCDEYARRFRGTHRCEDPSGSDEFAEGNIDAMEEIAAKVSPDVVFIHAVPRIPDFTQLGICPPIVRMVHDVSLMCPIGHGYFRHGKRSCHHPVGWRCWLDLAFLAPNPAGFLPVRYASINEKRAEIARNRRVDAIITVSEYMKSRLVGNGFRPDEITVVSPVSTGSVCDPTPVPDAHELLFVGSLLRGKGVDLLFHALAKVGRKFHLSIVGTGKSEQDLKRLAEQLGIADSVTFHGWVSNEHLGAFYLQSKIVVLPVRAPESFCLIGPDAMRHGRPVVAFDVGGISSWLEHERTGFLVPEQDTDAFAAAIRSLLDDTPRAQLFGDAAAERFKAKYLKRDYVDDIERVLKKVVEARRQ